MQEIHLDGQGKADFVRALFAKSEGRWVNVLFSKRTTGKDRDMTCRVGVKKYTTGVGLAYDPKRYNLQGVWEPAAGEGADAYRMVDLTSVKRMVVDGEEYRFL